MKPLGSAERDLQTKSFAIAGRAERNTERYVANRARVGRGTNAAPAKLPGGSSPFWSLAVPSQAFPLTRSGGLHFHKRSATNCHRRQRNESSLLLKAPDLIKRPQTGSAGRGEVKIQQRFHLPQFRHRRRTHGVENEEDAPGTQRFRNLPERAPDGYPIQMMEDAGHEHGVARRLGELHVAQIACRKSDAAVRGLSAFGPSRFGKSNVQV